MSKSGFSLIEVMVAIAIFTVGIIGTMGLQYRVVSGNASGNITTQEALLAQKILEVKKNISNLSSIDTAVPANIDMGAYQAVITVSQPIDDNSRFITVTVDRNGGVGGHAVTVRAMTMGNGV